ncbi:MAG: 6,7-dimethyl-8-ribityllumazine synthase [Candidatus Eremiobacteraeota bacterium]|nr:6,7-dimethyl-8-ribityllumazine synthase [Candidatus Eremiobacteraeota bacterium]
MKHEKTAAALPDCRGKRFAIVTARFYRELTDNLVDGARRALRECGVADESVDAFDVPGCFELPLAAFNLIEREQYDGIVALGVVIRGDTPHFDFVAGQCARGIMDVQLATGTPIGFGVLTTENFEQAEERADPARGDKGYEAAIAAATLASL